MQPEAKSKVLSEIGVVALAAAGLVTWNVMWSLGFGLARHNAKTLKTRASVREIPGSAKERR